jgi:DUF4097 and DUF4098 domain-containing protein YvlB
MAAMTKFWIAGVAVITLTAGAATSARADDWNKKYSVNGKAGLYVRVNDGNVDVTASNGNEIEARVTTSGWRIPNDVRISEEQDGNHVNLTVSLPHQNWNWFGSNHRSVRIELRVPKEADLDISSGDGNVTAQGVSGSVHIQTSDGNMNVQNVRGDIRLHTGDGHVEGREIDGAMDVDTSDGHVTLSGRFDALKVHTGDGHVDVEAQNGSSLGNGWSLRSGDGSITLRLPDNLNADLDAHTGDGHISMSFPLTISGSMSDSSIRGKINGGGPTLYIRTGDGSIRIERL